MICGGGCRIAYIRGVGSWLLLPYIVLSAVTERFERKS